METKKALANRMDYIPRDGPSVSRKIPSEFGTVPTLSRLSTDPLEAYLQEAVIIANNRKQYIEHGMKLANSDKDPANVTGNDSGKSPANKEESHKHGDNRPIKDDLHKVKRSVSKKGHHANRDRSELLRQESRRAFEKEASKLALNRHSRHKHESSKGGSSDLSEDRNRREGSAHKETAYNDYEARNSKEELPRRDKSKLKDEVGARHHRHHREDSNKIHNRRASREDVKKLTTNKVGRDDAVKHDRVHRDSASKAKVRRDDRVNVRSAVRAESNNKVKRVIREDPKTTAMRTYSKERASKEPRDDSYHHSDYSGKERSARSGRRTASSRGDVANLFSGADLQEDFGMSEDENAQQERADDDYL